MAGFSELPALDIQGFNVLDSKNKALDFQTKQTLLPGQIQESQDEASVRHTNYQNSAIANAAAQVLSLDPDQRPAAWDQTFSDLAEKGIPQARQYIGRYDENKAKSLQSIFSGQAGQKANAAAQQNVAANPQMVQQLMQQPPEQRQKSIQNLNQAITAIGRVNNSDDLNSEINLLKQSGIAFDPKQVPGLDLTRTDSRGYTDNYRALYNYLQNQIPLRDAMIQAEQNQALGIKPAPNLKDYGGHLYDLDKQQWAPPPPSNWKPELLTPDKTGKDAAIFDPNTKTVSPVGGGGGADNTALASKLMQDENRSGNPNAQNPAPGQTAGGINGMIDKTYIAAAKAAVPALKNASDADILQMKKDGTLNSLNTMLVGTQNKLDAQYLSQNKQPVTNASVAMAYKLGGPDALKVLNAQPNTPLDQILSPKVMAVNPQLKGMTAGGYGAYIHSNYTDQPFAASDLFGPPKAKGGASDLTPEENTALTTGIANGTIDGGRVNSRTAKIYADIALKNPDVNMVNSAGHAAMVRNAPYQRTINIAEALPQVLNNVKEAGEKLNYSDAAFVGKAQAWMKGQYNDPDFVSYMTQRNDAIMSIAGVMRTVGMSDYATHLEDQVANPSMSPRAVDAWAAAQMKSLAPRLEKYRRDELGALVNQPAGGPINPGGGPPMSPQDQAAIAWAKANPNDPRAAKIKQKLGVR